MDRQSTLGHVARRTMPGLAGLLLASGAYAQATRVVSGTTVDSASGLPLAGALVELRSPTDRRTVRSDEAGLFRIRALDPGRYQLSVLRIGFDELKQELVLSSTDTTLTLAMRPAVQRLEGFRVRGDVSAVYGIVAAYPNLLPIPGARVQVLGGEKPLMTDSAGRFFVPVGNPGSYLIRMSHTGYVDRIFPVEVPRDRAVEASRMLDPGPGTIKAMDPLFADADQRLRYRGINSAIVPGAELRKIGGSLSTALLFAPSVARQGLRAAGAPCLFVNGVFRPNARLDMYDPDEIEAIEVYAANGDKTGDLWQRCNPRKSSASLVPRVPPSEVNVVKYIVIWLRK